MKPRLYGLLFAGLMTAAWHHAQCQTAVAGSIDQEYVVNPVNFGAAVANTITRAQTFTVGTSGLFDRVELQVGRAATTVENLTVEIRKTVAGVPDASVGALLASFTAIPSLFPQQNFPTGFVGFDLGASSFPVQSGDVLAINLSSAATESNWYLWSTDASGTYAGGHAFSRSPPSDPYAASVNNDSGFRTFVEPVSLQTAWIASTFDVEATASDAVNFAITDGGIFIEQYRNPGNEYTRGLMEFDISQIPTDATIVEAHLSLEITGVAGGGALSSIIDLYGYAGDGVPTSIDATQTGNLVGSTGPLDGLGGTVVDSDIDVAFVQSLLGSTDHLGVVAVAGLDFFQSTFGSSEYAAGFPPGTVTAPTLHITYVPEPATFCLLLVGASLLVVIRRNAGPGRTSRSAS